MNRTNCIVAVALLAAVSAAGAQTLYRWVDDKGGVHFSDTPPPAQVKQVEEKRARHAGEVEAGPSYAMSRAQRDFPVSLYSDGQCGEACKTARELLQRRGIPFNEVVLKTEEDRDAFTREFGGEKPSVPSITVGRQKQIGFEAGVWQKLLDDAGYPRTAPTGRAKSAP